MWEKEYVDEKCTQHCTILHKALRIQLILKNLINKLKGSILMLWSFHSTPIIVFRTVFLKNQWLYSRLRLHFKRSKAYLSKLFFCFAS